jgi:hypothetical protein
MPRPTLRLPVSARPLLERLRAAARASGQRLFLAGGYLRDRVLGTEPKPELDFTLANPRALLATLPLLPGESAFLLDGERDTFRIALAPRAHLRQVDLTRLRAPSIEGDLLLRDFTANAIAADVTAGAPLLELIDPAGGVGDLSRGTLRACAPRSFADDPLRVLRGVRIACSRGLRIDPATARRMVAARAGLRRVSRERVREEFFLMLQGPEPVLAVRMLARLDLLGTIGFPRPAPGRRLAALARVHRTCRALPPRGGIRLGLAETLEQGVQRLGILHGAALLRDLGAERRAGTICAGLMLGTRATRVCTTLLGADVEPSWYRRGGEVPRAAWLAFFTAADEARLEAFVLHAPSPVAARGLLARYAAVRRRFLRPPLLTGDLAMRELGAVPGPDLGRLLAAARRAQNLGAYANAAGALGWARERSGIFPAKTPPQRTP